VRSRLRALAATAVEDVDVDDPALSGTGGTATASTSTQGTTDDDLYGCLMIKPSHDKADDLTLYLALQEYEIKDDSDLLAWWKVQVRFSTQY